MHRKLVIEVTHVTHARRGGCLGSDLVVPPTIVSRCHPLALGPLCTVDRGLCLANVNVLCF